MSSGVTCGEFQQDRKEPSGVSRRLSLRTGSHGWWAQGWSSSSEARDFKGFDPMKPFLQVKAKKEL